MPYLLTLSEKDVGQTWLTSEGHRKFACPLGRIERCDIGKHVYYTQTRDGRFHYSVESQSQWEARIRKWEEKGERCFTQAECDTALKNIDNLVELTKKKLELYEQMKTAIQYRTEWRKHTEETEKE